jgi:hypothetical protein
LDRPGKKTAAALHQEISGEINAWLARIFAERHKTRRTDLEAVEMSLRTTLHQVGSIALQQLLQYEEPALAERTLACPCGQPAQYLQLRSKTVLTVLGKVELRRPYYRCPQCGNGQFPVDEELDVNQTSKSPGVRRMLAMVGQESAFVRGQQQMKLLANLDITAKEVERTAEATGADLLQREQEAIQSAFQQDLPVVLGKPIPVLYIEMDGTGVPVVRKETQNRMGKTPGQPAHTREAKLGCVFTQTTCDPEGYAIRDPDSTTYTGAIESAQDFGKRIYLEAWNRGWSQALKKVVLADGAEWIWNLAELHFPGAIQIVDLFHARQHLWELARALHPNDAVQQKRWILRQQSKLDEGQIQKLVRSLRSIDCPNPELRDKIHTEADYFARNAARMRYPEFRRLHLFVGSGVVEAGCKTVIGSRTKQSGMFWTVRGANSIIALRCCHLNGRFENYWEARRA